jgi:hypothetical protein
MKSLLLTLLFLILAIVIVGVIALGVANLGVDRTATKNHLVYGTVKEIVVKAGRGDVELVPSDSLIRVREQQHYVIEKPTLEPTRSGGVLTLEPKCDDTYPDVVPCFSNLRVSVPAGVKVTIDGKGGDVDARSIDVRATHIETGSGDIDLGVVGRAGLLWAHSASGDIELVAASARAVDAQSDSGDVHVDVAAKPRKVHARSESGDVEIALPRGIYAIKTKSASGDVRARGLSRNAASASTIDVRTDSGDISLRPR